MKRILILLTIVFTSPFYSQEFNGDFSQEKEVTSVVVNHTMLELLTNFEFLDDEGDSEDFSKFVSSVNYIKFYSTANSTSSKTILDRVDSYVNSKSTLVELMKMKEDGAKINFYVEEGEQEGYLNEILMLVDGGVSDLSEFDLDVKTLVVLIEGKNVDTKFLGKLFNVLDMPGESFINKI